MSTFKIQPVYAELIMGWLACAEREVPGMSWDSVLGAVAWRFKGGKMGDYAAKHPTPCSENYFPDGTTEAMLRGGEGTRDRRALRE
jgi:hypothetical protein